MFNSLKGMRRFWWLGGVVTLFVALVLALVVLPVTAPIRGADGPDVQVPKMENVPAPEAPRMQIEVEPKRD